MNIYVGKHKVASITKNTIRGFIVGAISYFMAFLLIWTYYLSSLTFCRAFTVFTAGIMVTIFIVALVYLGLWLLVPDDNAIF